MQINRIIGANLIHNAGYARRMPVKMGGTDWVPEIPDVTKAEMQIAKILQIESATERALSLFLYLARSQLFFDGNKRTATLAANHILIANGKGILSIPIKHHQRFFELLLQFMKLGSA